MSILLADIDATCAALGYSDGKHYHAEPEALQGLKHLIWILRRDTEYHEYRRHLGHAKVLQTDLVYMLPDYVNDNDYADVLIRLLVILTNPTLLLFRDGPPKDNHGRKVFLELIDILQDYKTAFACDELWISLYGKLKQSLAIDWSIRSEDQNLLIERILILIRNVLQIPVNQEIEYRTDNDASLHDQVIWALHKSGILDLLLFIISTMDEHQFHLHCVEIMYLLFREQTADNLADASLQRSVSEKLRDEQELMAARQRERQRFIAKKPLTGRHSRFGGTYVLRNVKSVSDRDIICHQPLERVEAIDFDREKQHQKRSFRHVKEQAQVVRRSTFSVRLCLREYCIEILNSAYNALVHQVRRLLQRANSSNSHDDSYLLWVVRFFMEFNRLHNMKLELVSESLSVQYFHWVLTRIQHDMDMIVTDKQHSRLWAKRLHVALLTFRELLHSLLALQKLQDDNALALFSMLLNNVCYVLEYRETILHLLMNYNETHSTKAFLRDVVETANIFIKIMEKFCKDEVLVQEKKKKRKKNVNTKNSKTTEPSKRKELTEEDLSNQWAIMANDLSQFLTNQLQIENQPVPYDAASDQNIEDQRDVCLIKIHKLLRKGKLDHAIALLRSAREIWPESDVFGAMTAAPEDELLLLREIYMHDISADDTLSDDDNDNQELCNEDGDDNNDHDDDEEEDEEPGLITVEKTFKFDDFLKRLLNGRIVRACVMVLNDWEHITTKSLKAAVTILHRIAYECSCPAMLYQAKLFRIFQQVFHAARDTHHEELRRLGIYVVRKFIKIAPTNPKIYAELFFYKSLKEANELENGYCDDYESGTKGAWSEEQELELRLLFDENQKNPATDKDVIDWILDNIIDKTRTRRGILKKLKEMGLMFKAPTKKSTAKSNRADKNLWKTEEDEELHNLYDQYRMNNDCLSKILIEYDGRRNKQQIIKRMLQLGIIADKSEILPQKRKKRIKNASNNIVENLEGNLEEKPWQNERRQRKPSKNITQKRRNIVKTPLELGSIKYLLNQIDQENYKDALEWLYECLNDAADDIDPNEAAEEDDGVPLVPLLDIQKQAMEDDRFKKFLIALGIQPPIYGMENYWRIPTYLNCGDLKLRANIIIGKELELENNNESENDQVGSDDDQDNNDNDENYDDNGKNNNNNNNDDDDDDDYLEILGNKKQGNHKALNYLTQRREKMQTLIFNNSDEENIDEDAETKRKKILSKKRILNNKKNMANNSKLVKQKKNKKKPYNLSESDEDSEEDTNNRNETKESNNLFDKLKRESLNAINKNHEGNDNSIDNLLQFNSENYRKRLDELEDDDTKSSNEDNNQLTFSHLRRHNVIESDDEQENEEVVANMPSTSKQAKHFMLDDDNDDNVNDNDDDDDSDNDDINRIRNKKRSRLRTSSTEENDDDNGSNNNNKNNVTTKENINAVKDENFPNKRKVTKTADTTQNILNKSNEKPAKRRRLAVIDDTDDEDN